MDTIDRDRKVHVGKIQNLTEQLNLAIDKWYNMSGCSIRITQIDQEVEDRSFDTKPFLLVRCFKEIKD